MGGGLFPLQLCVTELFNIAHKTLIFPHIFYILARNIDTFPLQQRKRYDHFFVSLRLLQFATVACTIFTRTLEFIA